MSGFNLSGTSSIHSTFPVPSSMPSTGKSCGDTVTINFTGIFSRTATFHLGMVVASSVGGAVVAMLTLIGLILCVVYLTKRTRRRKRGQLNDDVVIT
jgi:hypothetical protein